MNGYSTTWSVDKMLANQLPDYATSVQRESVLSRFLNVTNEIAKANFIRKHEEVVKLPEDRKTDLRTRFPGLVVPDDGQGVKDEPSMQEEAAR
jgi:S-adenosylmethionine:diacylglycerol 3-amino-3-carboxypropyl transferase